MQYQGGVRDLALRNGLDIVSSARMFAVLNAATADAGIACWRAKYDFAFWRPITAIQLADTDGNPATAPDKKWTPLVGTPAYPEYPSGHACLTGADVGRSERVLRRAPHRPQRELAGRDEAGRHFDTARALNEETMNARIWLGLHFRRAMTDANRLGQDVTSYVLRNAFRPAWGRTGDTADPRPSRARARELGFGT